MSPASEMPQFAILYGGRSSDLTPRQAFLLWSGLQLQLDDFIGAAEGETSLIDLTSSRLSRIARVYETTEFRRRMAASAQTLIERLCSGYFSDALAHTTSEEVLLCMAIDRVAELLTDMPDALLHDGIDSDIPLVDKDDADLEFLRDLVLGDSDIPLLYDPALDGAERDPAIMARFDAYLHPNEWFTSKI